MAAMYPELEQTFLDALDRNKDRIYRMCLGYVNDTEDAKDLFQEVLIQVWRSLPGFKGKASIDTWIYRITVNTCLRIRQQVQKHRERSVRLDGVRFVPDNDQPAYDTDTLKKLRQCIQQLPEVDKGIVLLYLEELPYKEIADITGLTENHIAVKMKRIKKRLLTCIKS